MVVPHSTDLTPAVAYLRMSSDEQSLSPEQQRREVQEYADRNGYRILRWYVDEGVSASKGRAGDEHRVGYQQLLIDSNAREWEAVICWSTARFTRNHPHEAAQGKAMLRANGVRLVTIKEGVIDWNTFEGVLKDTLYNLMDHKYSVDLGKESLRGRRHTFIEGGYPYGSIPYGYRHVYLCGAERREVPRHQKTKNLRGWTHTLAAVEHEASVVRRAFDLYVNHDKSICAVAILLNRDGVPGPGRGVDACWTVQNLRRLLSSKVYVRISRIGTPQQKRPTLNRLNPEERLGNWPALVERDLWDRAQAKLLGNQGRPHEGKSGALQGILRCGVCGRVLHKENPRKAADPRGDKYRCAGTTTGLLVACHRWTVYEAEILPRLARELVQAVDEETLRLAEAQPGERGKISNAEVLRAHIASLERRVQEAARAFTDPDVSPPMRRALQQQVEKLDQEMSVARERLESTEAAEERGGVGRFLDWWEGVRPDLLILSEGGAVRVTSDTILQPAGTDETVFVAQGGDQVVGVRLDAQGDRVVARKGDAILADAGKLRALLKWLKVQVRVYWRQPTAEERVARRKGRGHGCPGRLPEWVIDQARLNVEINCGSSDDRNVSGDCRAASDRGSSRHRASRGPSGSP